MIRILFFLVIHVIIMPIKMEILYVFQSQMKKKGKFVFRGLSSKENIISDIVNADDFIVAGNVLIGDNNKQPLSNTTLF